MIRFAALLIFAVSLSIEISGQKIQSRKSQETMTVRRLPKQFEISLTKSFGSGPCFEYRTIISRSGIVNIRCVEGLLKDKEFSKPIAGKLVAHVVATIYEVDYFGLRNSLVDEKDGCHGIVSNHPWIKFSIRLNAQKSTVTHYLGCLNGSPRTNRELRRIHRLEKVIEDVASLEKFKNSLESFEK